MPKIDEIKKKEPFKKTSYRPWDDAPRIVQTPILNAADDNTELLSSKTSLTPPEGEQIVKISPEQIKLWKYKDRPENELGDISAFAKEILAIGQQQPGVVRECKDDLSYKYELIIGERRWRACMQAKIPFKAIISSISDNEACLAQAAENEDRKQLSDYAKGMSFSLQIHDGIITFSDLVEKLGQSKQQVSRLLSFKDIPKALIDAIGDMTKVSARTAEEIRALCNKSAENTQALISIADKIATGIGAATLLRELKQVLEKDPLLLSTEKVISKTGRHLFSWRKDGNGNRSISFPKDIRKYVDYKELETALTASILNQLDTPSQFLSSPHMGTNLKE